MRLILLLHQLGDDALDLAVLVALELEDRFFQLQEILLSLLLGTDSRLFLLWHHCCYKDNKESLAPYCQYIKLKSNWGWSLGWHFFLALFWERDSEPMAKLDEPSLGGFEGVSLAVLDGEPPDLFFVS